ncbi:immunoglobulin superfamily member 3-like isoform X1 [Brachyhypopomus gauderio]|uniref:immunoglobulin superfamily member 3-like isoform X1 n=1 Tax=Brachyhypopomus gauderio TaxID=698409 RepID=UPI004042938F
MSLSRPPRGLQALLAFLTGLLCSGVISGQRLVEMPAGPLFRVKGFPMALSCYVSNFKGSSQQDFAFSVYKDSKQEQEIRIIHTSDPNYAYAIFTSRVNTRDVAIERLSGSSAVLHFASLRMEDAGTYECFTPNTDGTYFGSYTASTEVNVIEDTLVASSSDPASLIVSEGDLLQLKCQVSSHTFQHTHLSVTWYVRGTEQTFPIISLDKDLTVRPGSSFEHRYLSGLISIEKVEDTTYRLRISQVQPSDSGEIYCQADEWILDPDRSWMRIAYKNTTGSNVKVETLNVNPDADSFTSHIELLTGEVQEGGPLEIRCSVKAQNVQTRFFSVSWLKNQLEVAQIGPSGVLTVSADYTGRHKKGELRAIKISDSVFALIIQPIMSGDQGQYQCRVGQEERTDSGLFTRGHTEISSEAVHIIPKGQTQAFLLLCLYYSFYYLSKMYL